MSGVPESAREKLADHLSPYVGEALAGIRREAPHILDLYRERADAALADILPLLRRAWEEELLGDAALSAFEMHGRTLSMSPPGAVELDQLRDRMRAAIQATHPEEGAAMGDWPDEVEMVIDVCDDPPRPFLPRDVLDPEGAWRQGGDYLTEIYVPLSKVRERLLSDGIEAAAKAAHRRSWERAPETPAYTEGAWTEIADEPTREHFRDLVRAPVEAALDAAFPVQEPGEEEGA